MRNENVCTCEKCGKEILKMTQLMHTNHCPGNRQHQSQQPLIDPSDVDFNFIDNDINNNKGEDDMQYKMCVKCNLYFPENEYEDHMLCHKIEDDDTAEINRRQQERQQRQQQQQHQQMHSHVHQYQHQHQHQQQRPPQQHQHQHHQHHQPQSSIQRVMRTSTDNNGNTIQEKEDHYSDGRIVISKVVFDPNGNRISSSTSSYFNDRNNNNNQTHNIFNIPGISIFSRGNIPYAYNFSFGSPNYNQRHRIVEPIRYNIRLPYNQMPFPIENLFNQLMAIPKTNPVPKEVIDDLPQTVVNDASKLSSEKKNCVICLTDFENGDKTIVLPCIHLFHYDCIVQWFGSHNSCPVCKYEVTGNNNH